MTNVREIASKGIATVEFDRTADYAAKKMAELDFGSLLVMQKGIMVGIVTERDLTKKVLAKNVDPHKINVENIMSKPLITIESSMSFIEATRLMSEKRIKRLPIMERGAPIGILTMTDIINYLSRFRLDIIC